MIKKLLSLLLIGAFAMTLTGCEFFDIPSSSFNSSSNRISASAPATSLTGDAALVGIVPFLINGAGEGADPNALAQALADDITANGAITKLKAGGRLRRRITATNNNADRRVRSRDNFTLSAVVNDASDEGSGNIGGTLLVTVNDVTANATARLERDETRDPGGFLRTSNLSFVIVTANLLQSTVDALSAADPIGSELISKQKTLRNGNIKVTIGPMFIDFNSEISDNAEIIN